MKLGIIGCGGIAYRFAKAAAAHGDIELAVAAREVERARDFALKVGETVTTAYGGYKAMLDNELLDGVYIALPHHLHYEWVEICLERGIPVLCEKPMVLTESDAKHLFEIAKKHNTLLVEAMWSKMLPGFKQAKEWIAAGKIGRPLLIDSHFGIHMPFDETNRYYNKSLAGGALFDLGVYNIHFSCGLLDEYPIQVTGSAHISKTGVDEHNHFELHFNSGAVARASSSFYAQTDRLGTIYGTKGSMTFSSFYEPKTVTVYNEQGRATDRYEADDTDGFVHEVAHFVSLIQAGKKESDLVRPNDTIACARIFDNLNQQWGIQVTGQRGEEMKTAIKVLVVDDVSMMRRTLKKVLVDHCGVDELNIREASKGSEALACYREMSPELVLLDITLKAESGLDVLDKLLELDPEAHIVMCTASVERAVVMDSVRRGAKGYVLKPAGESALKAVVEELKPQHPEKFS